MILHHAKRIVLLSFAMTFVDSPNAKASYSDTNTLYPSWSEHVTEIPEAIPVTYSERWFSHKKSPKPSPTLAPYGYKVFKVTNINNDNQK